MMAAWALMVILGLLFGRTGAYRFGWNFDEGTLGVYAQSRQLQFLSFLTTQDVHFLDYENVYQYGSVAGVAGGERFLNSEEWTIGFWKRVGMKGSESNSIQRTLLLFPDGAILQTRFDRYDIIYNRLPIWDTSVLADMRIRRDTSFGEWERVTFVCKGSSLSLYINKILMKEVTVNTIRLRENPRWPANFNGTIRFGIPESFFDLNITGIFLLKKALTKEQVIETVYFRVPPGTKLYLPTLSTQGPAPLSEYIPHDEFDEGFLFSSVPPVGEFPRLLFNSEDLPRIRSRMSNSTKGRFSLERAYAQLGKWLDAEGEWFRQLEQGITSGPAPNSYQLARLSDFAMSALLTSDQDTSLAHRVANATYWAIIRIRNNAGTITTQYGMERVGSSHAIFLAFDMAARFMPPDRVKASMAFFVDLGKNAYYYKELPKILSQQDIEESLKTKMLWRGSNTDIWPRSTLCMNQILIHGWPGSDPMDIQQWNPYFQRILRSLHTQNGNGVEPFAKEATDRVRLVALALKRLLPSTPNFLAHPQLYRWYESKVLTLLPFAGNLHDMGTWQRGLFRPSSMSSLFPDNPIFAFGTRFGDVQHPGYLPASQRAFAIRNREAYGFLTNQVPQSDVHLAFTTNPARPTRVVEGQRPGSFRTNTLWGSDGAETTDVLFQGDKPFNLTIELIDENFPMHNTQQDLFAIVSEADEPIFVLTVLTGSNWGFVVGWQVVASIPRIVNKWVTVEIRFSGSALEFVIDGDTVGSAREGLPPLSRLFLVIGYRQHRTRKIDQNRCVLASYGRIQASEGGNMVLDVGNFLLRDTEYLLDAPVGIEDIYDVVDSTNFIPALARDATAVDLSPLRDALPAFPLEQSDSDIGRFSARASLSPDTTSVVFFSGQGGHQKKSAGHVDIIGAGLPWIFSSRRLGQFAEEYMTIFVDGREAPGQTESEIGYLIGARRSSLASGAAMDMTLSFRNRNRVFLDKDDYFSSNEFPATSETIDARFAYRSVAFLSGRGGRAVVLVVDSMRMMDGKSHNFTHSSPFFDTDWISSEKPLSGRDGDYEYVISTNRSGWRDLFPLTYVRPSSWEFSNPSPKSCLVKVLRGSQNRKPVKIETRKLYGYTSLGQFTPGEVYYEPTGKYTLHFGNQIRVSVEDTTADFVTAYYPHEEGEPVPEIYWLTPRKVRVVIDSFLSHTVILLSSGDTDRTVLTVRSTEIVDGKERTSTWKLDP